MTTEYKIRKPAEELTKRGAQYRRKRLHALAGQPVPQDRCDICGRNPREGRRGNESLCLDHDHVTGAFRGCLCHSCNMGLGLIGDNERSVRRVLAYLRRTCKAPPKPSGRLAGMLKAVAGSEVADGDGISES